MTTTITETASEQLNKLTLRPADADATPASTPVTQKEADADTNGAGELDKVGNTDLRVAREEGLLLVDDLVDTDAKRGRSVMLSDR